MDRIKTEVRVTSGWWMRTVVAADDDDLWIGGQDPQGLFVRLWRFRRALSSYLRILVAQSM
jgi:hypothetical protein